MTPQEENVRIQQQVNEELRAYMEAQRLATKETEKSAEIEAKAAGLTATSLQILEKLYSAQLNYALAMAKGKKGASQFNDSIDAMTEATQMAAVALSLLVPGGALVKGVVAGLTFLATQAMKTAAEMQKAANDQADATYKAFQAFSKAGATGADGLTGFFNDVQRMRLNVYDLDALAGAMATSAKELASMGGTVYKARKEFADLMQGMRPFEQGMLNLGLSQEEQAEATLGYMKLQSTLSQGQQRDYGKLAGGMKKYLVETEALARVTGLNRKEQEATQEKFLSQQRFGAKIAELEAEGTAQSRKAAELLIAGLKRAAAQGETFAQAYADTTTGMLGTDAAIKGNMSTQGAQMQQINDILEGRITNEDQLNASQQDLLTTTKAFGKDMNKVFQMGVGEDFLAPFAEFQGTAKLANQNFAEQMEDAKTQVEMLAQTIGGVDQQLTRFTKEVLMEQIDQQVAYQAALAGKFSTETAGGGFMDQLIKALQPTINLLIRLGEIALPGLLGTVDIVIQALNVVSLLLTGDFVGAFKATIDGVWSFATGWGKTVELLIQGLYDMIDGFAKQLESGVKSLFSPLITIFNDAGTVISGFGDSVKTGLAKFTDALVDVVKDLFKKLTALIPNFGTAVEYAQTGAQAVKNAGASVSNFVSSVFGGAPAAAPAAAPAPAGGGAPAGAPPAPASSTAPTSAPAGGGSAPKPATQRDSGDASRTANNAPPPDGKKGAGGALDDAATKAMIARHEGTRLSPYKDSLGLWTVGVGHLIGDGKSLPDSWNRQFSREEVMAMFDKDYEKHKAEAKSNTPNFDSMSGQMKSAFVDLAFNMGGNWLNTGNKGKGWPILKKQLNSKDAEGAADNLANSKWADDVKGGRAGTILGLIKSGFAANGGIFDGPKSGYPMTLHGEEAVIPLKDSAVPVTMSKEFNTTAANLGELVNIMKNNVGMQATMLAVLEDMRRSQSNTADNTSRMAAVAAN